MAIKDHQLVNETLANVKDWALPKIEGDLKRKGYQVLLEHGTGYEFSPKQRYEYGSYYWCGRLVSTLDRLENIRSMTGRSLYRKKNEERSVLLQEWISYNYENYTIVYQGILDITLLLVNDIFDMGNPYHKCSYGTVYDNTRISGTGIRDILKKLKNVTTTYRKGKNLLVHRGERIKLPVESRTLDRIDMTNIAIKLGIEVDDDLKEAIAEFLAIYTKSELLTLMEKECREIETLVEKLFDKLLPYYRAVRSFYP